MNSNPGIQIYQIGEWILHQVEYRYEVLRDFANNVEEWTAKESSAFRELTEQEAEKIDDYDVRSEFFEWKGEQVAIYEETYPSFARNLIVAKAYFIFESELGALVNQYEKSMAISYKAYKKRNCKKQKLAEIDCLNNYLSMAISYKEYKKHNCKKQNLAEIDCLNNYLSNVDLSKVPKSILWDEITAIRLIRNAIVHNSGILEEKHFSKVRGTQLEQYAKIVLSHPLVFHRQIQNKVIDTLLAFFRAVDKDIHC